MSSLNQKLERAFRRYLMATAGTPGSGEEGTGVVTMVINDDAESVVNTNDSITTALVSNLGSRFELNWYVGETTDVIRLPAVVVISPTATEDEHLNRNFFCDVDIEVRFWGHNWSSYPDVVASLEEISEAIRAALLSDDLPNELSVVEPAFSCQGVASRTCGRVVEGKVRMHRYTLNLYCCESDLVAA